MPKNKTRKDELNNLIIDSMLEIAVDLRQIRIEGLKILEPTDLDKAVVNHIETYVKRRIELDRLEHGIL